MFLGAHHRECKPKVGDVNILTAINIHTSNMLVRSSFVIHYFLGKVANMLLSNDSSTIVIHCIQILQPCYRASIIVSIPCPQRCVIAVVSSMRPFYPFTSYTVLLGSVHNCFCSPYLRHCSLVVFQMQCLR